ncbi:MAG: Crp/Fnr family transcriptional regulator [Bacteroidetes bacterium]|nr:MAG: Crp/Fnr family transcriptional regulator [Bacteroidota bacterium]
MSNINAHCRDCKTRYHGKLHGIGDESLDSIDSSKTCNMYKKGQRLIQEGTRPLGVYCIKSGKVKVFKLGQQGKEHITTILKEGDLVGYRAMLSDSLYHVSVEALEEVVACHIPREEFLKSFQSDKVLNNTLITELSTEVISLTNVITDIAQKPVRERTAATLVLLNTVYSSSNNGESNGSLSEINLTRESLANMVGTATETLIRIIHDFKEEELITTNGRKINIQDLKALQRIGGIY